MRLIYEQHIELARSIIKLKDGKYYVVTVCSYPDCVAIAGYPGQPIQCSFKAWWSASDEFLILERSVCIEDCDLTGLCPPDGGLEIVRSSGRFKTLATAVHQADAWLQASRNWSHKIVSHFADTTRAMRDEREKESEKLAKEREAL
jgi:hypothetical protein